MDCRIHRIDKAEGQQDHDQHKHEPRRRGGKRHGRQRQWNRRQDRGSKGSLGNDGRLCLTLDIQKLWGEGLHRPVSDGPQRCEPADQKERQVAAFRGGVCQNRETLAAFRPGGRPLATSLTTPCIAVIQAAKTGMLHIGSSCAKATRAAICRQRPA